MEIPLPNHACVAHVQTSCSQDKRWPGVSSHPSRVELNSLTVLHENAHQNWAHKRLRYSKGARRMKLVHGSWYQPASREAIFCQTLFREFPFCLRSPTMRIPILQSPTSRIPKTYFNIFRIPIFQSPNLRIPILRKLFGKMRIVTCPHHRQTEQFRKLDIKRDYTHSTFW